MAARLMNYSHYLRPFPDITFLACTCFYLGAVAVAVAGAWVGVLAGTSILGSLPGNEVALTGPAVCTGECAVGVRRWKGTFEARDIYSLTFDGITGVCLFVLSLMSSIERAYKI